MLQALLAEGERELAAMRSSHYEHHTRVDEATGLYDYDCSGFVGYALKRSAPAAWAPSHLTIAARSRSTSKRSSPRRRRRGRASIARTTSCPAT